MAEACYVTQDYVENHCVKLAPILCNGTHREETWRVFSRFTIQWM